MTRLAVAMALMMSALIGPIPSVDAGALEADVTVHLLGWTTPVPVPQEAALTATVTNLGPAEAPGIRLTVELPEALRPMAARDGACVVDPAVSCTLDTLPAGGTTEVHLTVAAVRPGSHQVRGAAIHAATDPDPANDTADIVVDASGRSCDSTGTAGPDALRVGGRGAVACGLRGDDVLVGGAGRQVLLGGSGRDSLGGGRGRDRLDGGTGRDACLPNGRGCEIRGFATASSLPLTEVSPGTIGYGFHQSLFGTAIGMRPHLPHRIMASRGRGTGATTAVDVVVPSRARIRSPVTGSVVAVRRYLLYCRDPDWKVVLAPRSHPRLRVLVLHMARPAVREGHEVLAGITPLGRAARNDLPSAQANRYFPDRYPHVHVEVENDRASPTPGCSLGPADP